MQLIMSNCMLSLRTSIACFPFPFRTSVIALQFTEVLKHYIAICFLYTDSISKPDAVRTGIYLNTLKCTRLRSQIMFTVRWKGYNDSEGANNYSNRVYTYDLLNFDGEMYLMNLMNLTV